MLDALFNTDPVKREMAQKVYEAFRKEQEKEYNEKLEKVLNILINMESNNVNFKRFTIIKYFVCKDEAYPDLPIADGVYLCLPQNVYNTYLKNQEEGIKILLCSILENGFIDDVFRYTKSPDSGLIQKTNGIEEISISQYEMRYYQYLAYTECNDLRANKIKLNGDPRIFVEKMYDY